MFAFANPGFLYALPAGLLPVVLHLIFRRKRTSLKYPTLMFFRRVDMKLASRRKIKELLLLILRVLAVVLVVLALARPVARSAGGPGGSADCVLIIDNSASMSLPAQTGTRLEAAGGRAASLLAALGAEDRFALLTTVADSFAEVPALSTGKDRAQQALKALSATHGSGSLTGALARAKEIFGQTSGALNREIYIFSDFQENLFRDRAALAKAASEWPSPPGVFLCPVPGGAPKKNLSILSVSTDSRPKVTGRTLTLAVKVKNNSAFELASTLSAALGGAPPKAVPVTLPAGAEQDFFLPLVLGQEGFVAGEVKLEADDAAYDNTWPFCIDVRGPLRVRVFSPPPPAKPEQGEAFYLLKALDPAGDGRLSGIRVENVTTQRMPDDWSGCDCVIVCGVLALKADALAALESYVRRGGGLMYFSGPQDGRAASSHPFTNLLGGPVTGELRAAGAQKPYALLASKTASPFFDDSRMADGRVEFSGTSVFRALKIQPAADAETLAEFSAGSPALLTRREGQGRVVWWAFSAHPDDSNLPLQPQFLPLLHRGVVQLASAQTQPLSQKAGVPLQIDLSSRLSPTPGAALPAAVTVFDPEHKSAEVPVTNGRLDWRQTGRAGVYRMEAHGAAKSGLPPGFAIVPDADESDPGYLSAADAQSALGFKRIQTVDAGADLNALTSQTRQGRELFGYFILAALAALLAEVILANLIGVRLKAQTGAPAAILARLARRGLRPAKPPVPAESGAEAGGGRPC